MVDTLVEQWLQDDALVVGRAADQEVVGGVTPGLLQPGDVGLKAAGGEDDAARREIERLPAETGGDADEGPVLQVNPFHLRLVVGHDTEALAMAAERQDRKQVVKGRRVSVRIYLGVPLVIQ